MRVKVRAVIWLDGRLIVGDQLRGGRREVSLPGARVNDYESVISALERAVAEETGLQVAASRLLYVSETVQFVRVHELELIFLAEAVGIPALNGLQVIDVEQSQLPRVDPPILDQIIQDSRTGWRDTPRWLGNVHRPSLAVMGTIYGER